MSRFVHIEHSLDWVYAVWPRCVCTLAVLLVVSATQIFPDLAEARSLELIGVRGDAPAVARFIVRESESAFHYENLSLMELPLDGLKPAASTQIIDPKQALIHQRAGASDLHRIRLSHEETRLRDEAELSGFAAPEEISCHSSQVESPKPPTHLNMKGEGAGYAWTCILTAGGVPAARLLLEVGRSATMIHFAPDNLRPVIRVAQIPHMQVEIPHRGVRALPVISLSRGYRIPGAKPQESTFLLIFSRSRPLVPSLNTEHVLVMIHPQSLQGPDRGRIAMKKVRLQRNPLGK